MKIQKSRSFRKGATPWHDSVPFCLTISIFSAFVFYFSLAGIGVALENPVFKPHFWLPATLASFSAILLVANLFRVLSRKLTRPAEGP
jgi:uncharacterized membrane protein YbhN (UPF0104 family)